MLGYYKHLQTLPQQFFDAVRVGETISRVNDAVKIRNFINNVSLDLVVNITYVIPLGHESWIYGCLGYTKQDVVLFCYDRPFFHQLLTAA